MVGVSEPSPSLQAQTVVIPAMLSSLHQTVREPDWFGRLARARRRRFARRVIHAGAFMPFIFRESFTRLMIWSRAFERCCRNCRRFMREFGTMLPNKSPEPTAVTPPAQFASGFWWLDVTHRRWLSFFR